MLGMRGVEEAKTTGLGCHEFVCKGRGGTRDLTSNRSPEVARYRESRTRSINKQDDGGELREVDKGSAVRDVERNEDFRKRKLRNSRWRESKRVDEGERRKKEKKRNENKKKEAADKTKSRRDKKRRKTRQRRG